MTAAGRSLRLQALTVALQARCGGAVDAIEIARLRQMVEAETAPDRTANAVAHFLDRWPTIRRDPDRISAEGEALHSAVLLPRRPTSSRWPALRHPAGNGCADRPTRRAPAATSIRRFFSARS